MKYESAIQELIMAFPNLQRRDGYDDAIGLPHAMFGTVFCPWVRELLLLPNHTGEESAQIQKAFAFIEEMLDSEDDGLENVVLVTILNYLVDYCGMERVAPWCGPLSASWLHRLPPP